MSDPHSRSRADTLSQRFALVLFVIVICLVLPYQARLLHYMQWGDESETIVASRMIASGMRLYSDVFNHHGPLTFFSGVLLEKFGHLSVAAHRVPIAALQLVTLAALYWSPILAARSERRIFVAIAAIAMIAMLPDGELYGHTYTYQPIAGMFIAIALAQYTLPSILQVGAVRRYQVVLGNLLIVALPFLAITYAPAAILLFVASLRRAHLMPSLAAVIIGVVLNVLFLAAIGSFAGYWVDHFYVNAKLLPLYNGGQSPVQLVRTILRILTERVESVSAALVLLACIARLALHESKVPWRSACVAAALLSLLMRGNAIQGVPFWYALIAIAAILASTVALSATQRLVWVGGVMLFSTRLAYPLVSTASVLNTQHRSEHTLFGDLVQRVTEPDDRIIAWSFQNFEYLAADRMPASGNFFYLPWQQKYQERPMMGISINACDDIVRVKPKLMLIDKWLVWEKYPWSSYAECVQGVIDRDYRQIPGHPFYVRLELYDRAIAAFSVMPLTR